MTRVNTKIGDIFSVNLGTNNKRYFQYIANDRSQLNSDVIRGFSKHYPIDSIPNLSEIIQDEILFYAHCITKLGVKMGLWEKVGNVQEIGNPFDILFKDTNDYGKKVGEEPIKVSDKWYVWRINENFLRIGKLEGEFRKAYMGLVINPNGIVELLKGKKYPINYPE
ncbi:immunity 26/phosphotriesterase HocA family protein [Mucilaginibacter sp. HMF5004]|uniref:Imm26 family immunity protein n=1 Tax=Mucilaginibacter rivuli TaxID=2857527 RepID=UPI001C5CF0AC|nr:Imm26 family immunity protein [Mucilaginibacter rivuli]MBW4890150.1 immunity 26/phosphotriesterase HocA family protein [Mucilaginibacter rivuli]